MKKILMIAAAVLLSLSQQSFAQNSNAQYTMPPLLSLYYNVKDALVAGNPEAAATSAAAFVKTANSIDYKELSKANINTLVKDAGKISDTKDLKLQREYFASFSTNMTSVAKAVKLSDTPVYEVYCPMKKSSWLSSTKEVQNPYYGSSMLTCGKVTNTIE